MVRTPEVIARLTDLTQRAQEAEILFRNAATCAEPGSARILFIHFWQEHARLACELHHKIRWLGGELVIDATGPWGGLLFRDDVTEDDALQTLLACEAQDAELMTAYEGLIRQDLPIEVRAMLKTHALKLKGIHARVLDMVIRRSRPVGLHSAVATRAPHPIAPLGIREIVT
jgi:hypothetical protein